MKELNTEIQTQINIAAFFLAQENYTYDKLCWMLAKRRLLTEKDSRYVQEDRTKEKAAEIFFLAPPYDILCWLIAELDILIKFGKM